MDLSPFPIPVSEDATSTPKVDDPLGLNMPATAPTIPQKSPDAVNRDPLALGELNSQTPLKESTDKVASLDPARTRQVVSLARSTGQDPAVIHQNLDAIQKEKANPSDSEISHLQENYPKTTQYLQTPANAASNKDNIQNLMDKEQNVQDYHLADFMKKFLQYGANPFAGGFTDLAKNTDILPAIAPEVMVKLAKFGGTLSEVPATALNVFKTQEEFKLGIPQETFKNLSIENPLSRDFEKASKWWGHSKVLDESILELAKNGNIDRAAAIGTVQFLTGLPELGLTFASLPAAPYIAGLTQGAESAEKAERSGVSDVNANTNATLEGLTASFFTHEGTMKVFQGWAAKVGPSTASALVKKIGFNILKSQGIMVGVNTLQGWANDVIDQATGVDPKALENWGQKGMERALGGAIAGTFFGLPHLLALGRTDILKTETTKTEGGPAGPKAEEKPAPTPKPKEGASPLPDIQKAGVLDLVAMDGIAKQARETYLGAGKLAGESKLRPMDPVGDLEHSEHITQDSPAKMLYFPKEDLQTYYQEQNLDPEPIFEKMGAGESYRNDENVAVPMAKWVAEKAGTPDYEGLADHVKFDPGHKTTAEVEAAKVSRVEIDQHMEKAVEESATDFQKTIEDISKQKELANKEPGFKGLVQRIAGMLKQGKPSKAIKDVKAQALATARFYHVMAERLAKTPEEVPGIFNQLKEDYKINFRNLAEKPEENAVMTPLDLMKKSRLKLLIERPDLSGLAGGAREEALKNWESRKGDARSQGVPFTVNPDAKGATKPQQLASKFFDAAKTGFIRKGRIYEEAIAGGREIEAATPDANHDDILEEVRDGELHRMSPPLSQGPLFEGRSGKERRGTAHEVERIKALYEGLKKQITENPEKPGEVVAKYTPLEETAFHGEMDSVLKDILGTGIKFDINEHNRRMDDALKISSYVDENNVVHYSKGEETNENLDRRTSEKVGNESSLSKINTGSETRQLPQGEDAQRLRDNEQSPETGGPQRRANDISKPGTSAGPLDNVFDLPGPDVVTLFQEGKGFKNEANINETQQKELFNLSVAQGKLQRPADGEGSSRVQLKDLPAKFPKGYEPIVTTKLVKHSEETLKTNSIQKPEDAALAFGYLLKGAQERFDAIVTDKNGKPLALVGGFKGGPASTSVNIGTVAMEAFRVKGAANIWYGHNHPAGSAELSPQDIVMGSQLDKIFTGSKIKPRGSFAIAEPRDGEPANYAFKSPENGAMLVGQIPKGEGQHVVPRVERQFETNKAGAIITSPTGAIENLRLEGIKEPGLMLLNHRNKYLGFFPIDPLVAEKLRQGDEIGNLVRAFSTTNATGAIIANAEHFSQEGIKNIGGFLKSVDVTPHDVIQDGKSWQQQGLMGHISPTFKQGSGARGFMQMAGEPGKRSFNIYVNENSDASTFFHELGHAFLFIMRDLEQKTNDPEISKDLNSFYKWAGVDGWEGVKEKHHEMFARGFEYRIWQGNVPAPGLKRIFDRFAEWLRRVYPSSQYMEHYLGAPMTAEMKGVYDRLLATKSEIDQAKKDSGYDSSISADLPKALKSKLVQVEWAAAGSATDEVLKPMMKEMTAVSREEMDAHEKMALEVAHREVGEMPEFQAMTAVEKEEVDPREGAKAILSGEGGVPDKTYTAFEKAAVENGFKDYGDLAEAIQRAGDKDTLVAKKVDEYMAQFAPIKDTEKIQDLALKAVHNEKSLEAIAVRNEILKTVAKSGPQKGIQPAQLKRAQEEAHYAREKAKLLLSNRDWKEAGKPKLFIKQEQDAAIKEAKANLTGHPRQAEAFRNQKLVNHALVAEAFKNREESQKIYDKIKPFIKREGDLLKMPQGFTTHIDNLLENSGLKPPGMKSDGVYYAMADQMKGEDLSKGHQPDYDKIANETGLVEGPNGKWREENLAEFVKRHDKDGWNLEENISPEMIGGTTKTGTLTMGELRELKDAVMTIAHVGKMINKGNSNHYNQALAECSHLAATAFEDNVGKKYAVENRAAGEVYRDPLVNTPNKNLNLIQSEARAKLAKALRLPDRVIKSNIFLETLCRLADAKQEDGPLHRYLFWPLRDAATKEIELHVGKFDALNALMKKHYGFWENLEKRLFEKHDVVLGGIRQTLTREKLNNLLRLSGSKEGYQRLLDGFKATPDEIQAAIDKVDPKDLAYILDRADLDEKQWPSIAKNEMEHAGVELKRAEFRPIEYRGEVVSEGMYHRIKYNPEKSNEAFRQAAVNEAQSATQINPTTSRAFTKKRVPRVFRPPRLDDGVYNENQEEVIHDLAYRGVVQDVNRFLKSRELQKSMSDAVGTDGARMPGDQLRYMAASPRDPKNLAEKFWDFGRQTVLMGSIGIRPIAGIFKYLTDNGNMIWGPGGLGPQRWAKAMWEYNFIPGRSKKISAFVDAIDPQMKASAQNFNYDIAGFARQWNDPLSKVKIFTYLCERIADQHVRKPFYYEVYKQALAEHGDEDIAKNIAGQVVDRNLSTGNPLYHNEWQRGNVYVRSLAAARTFAFTQFNAFWINTKIAGLEYDKKNVGAATFILATAYATAFAIPAAIHWGTTEASRNTTGNPDEKERWKRLARKEITEPFDGLPPFPELVRFATQLVDVTKGKGRMRDLHLTPVDEAYMEMAKSISLAGEGIMGHHLDEKDQEEFIKGIDRMMKAPDYVQMVVFNLLDDARGKGKLNFRDFLSRKTRH